MENKKVKIIGAGLAGAEAALVLSRIDRNIQVELYEMRPYVQTAVHKTSKCAELVCSNSFKTMKPDSAAGMLKYELAALGSPVFGCALESKVDAGAALAVDRDKFSSKVANLIDKTSNIFYKHKEITNIFSELVDYDALILATGPLTSPRLSQSLSRLTGQNKLAFYDAAAPIIMAESINMDKVFVQDRYGEGSTGDYLNAPFSYEQYELFIDELVNADRTILHDFESKDLFQACQPIEEVARTGKDAPRYGALKPVGLIDPATNKRPWANVQLRAENKEKTAYNIVGFQTNLTFGEQKRVFRMIPGLENAEFARFGVMHKNTFIDAPTLLDASLMLRNYPKIYFAGQLCGTEGYLEAVRSGYHVALNVAGKLNGIDIPKLSNNTIFGSLIEYATNSDTKNYQPMHVNFGIIYPLQQKIRSKKDRYSAYAKRGKKEFDRYVDNLQALNLFCLSAKKDANYQVDKLNRYWQDIEYSKKNGSK